MSTYILQATSFGADASATFSVYYDTLTSSTQVLVASNVSQAQLLAGYSIVIPNDAYLVYTKNENGFCTDIENQAWIVSQ